MRCGLGNSATGTRTRVAQVRAEYPNQLDYGGHGGLAKSLLDSGSQPCVQIKGVVPSGTKGVMELNLQTPWKTHTECRAHGNLGAEMATT